MKGFISIGEFQQVFSVSRATVYRLRDRGEIRLVHIGRAARVPREDVEKFSASLHA